MPELKIELLDCACGDKARVYKRRVHHYVASKDIYLYGISCEDESLCTFWRKSLDRVIEDWNDRMRCKSENFTRLDGTLTYEGFDPEESCELRVAIPVTIPSTMKRGDTLNCTAKFQITNGTMTFLGCECE